MDELRMANLEKLVREVDHFLSAVKDSGVLPVEDRDGSWKLRISEDRMSAWLETYPSVGRGAPLDTWEIIDAIEETGILHLDREKVRIIVERCNGGGETTGEDALVASGTLPQSPVEGTIDFLVPFEKVRLIDENDERSIDWKRLWSIPTVHAGTAIARIHPPREGAAGLDIYGTSVPPPRPAPFRVRYGEGVIVSEENGVLEEMKKMAYSTEDSPGELKTDVAVRGGTRTIAWTCSLWKSEEEGQSGIIAAGRPVAGNRSA